MVCALSITSKQYRKKKYNFPIDISFQQVYYQFIQYLLKKYGIKIE